MDGYEFTLTYILDTINNSQAGRQFPTQANKKVWIILINVSYPIAAKVALGKFNVTSINRESRR